MAKTTFKEGALRAVAILGLLAILLLGAWGIIQIAFFISDLVSNAGGAASNGGAQQTQQHELITITVPSSATAGSPVTISWNHQGATGNYSYAVAYSCADGLTFKAPVPTGATQTVACNTPFNYTQEKSSIAITPVYSGTTDVKTTITVTATNLATGAITAQSSGTMTIPATKSAAPVKTTTTTKTSGGSRTTYVASAHRTQNLYGYSDLAVTITSAYSTNGNGTLQFVIQNVGSNVTPSGWTFNVTLPSGYQYPAGPQQALYPGDKIVYSMGYSDYQSSYTYGTCNQYGPCSVPGYSGGYQQPVYGYNPYGGCGTYSAYGYNCGNYYPGQGQMKQVTVTVDPYNQIMEAFKGNNTASASYVAY